MQATSEQKHIGQLAVAGKNIKVVAGAGCGKAQPLNELVLTPTGFITMKDIVKGTMVVSEEGKPITVLATIEHESLDMYELTFSDGSKARSCIEHLWEVRELNWKTGTRRKETVVRSLKQLLPRINKYRSSKKPYPYSVRLTQPVVFNEKEFIVPPYVLGYTLGNGFSAKAALKVAVGKADFNEIKSYFPKDTILSTYINKQNGVGYLNLAIEYRKAYESYGLYQVLSPFKHIPAEYLLGSIDQRKELLYGLMDSDGSCASNRAQFSTASKQLALDMMQLVRSLGGIASLSTCFRTTESYAEYSVQIRTPFVPFKLGRKASGYRIIPRDIDGDKRIVSAIYLGKMAGKCVTVDSEKQLYLTRDFTVTHNSSTLRYIAKQIPARNVLVLTFNKANAEETMAHSDRPENLFACTIHSLAYRAVVDAFYKKKLSNWLDYSDINPDTIKQAIWGIGLPPADEKKALVLLRRSILDTVKLFCQSAHMDVSVFAKSYLTWMYREPVEVFKEPLSSQAIDKLVTIVSTYWTDLVESPTAKINPDVYLKLFHLFGYGIKEVWSVELKRYVVVQVVALDEAQDSNGVTEAIFANQKHLQRIVVGDPNQQLYRWRGAGDTMNQFPDFSIGYLSTSFRFNQEIARMANIVLERNNSPLRLTGNSTRTAIETRAILCRTNATVLDTFFTLVTADGFSGKVAISTDTKTTFSKMYHLEACWFDRTPKYPVSELASITDKKSMIEALEYSDELQRLNNLSQKLVGLAGSLYKAQEMLKQYIATSTDTPVVTISTIHSSKGLEYSHVTIADDFISIKEDEDIFEQVEYMWENIDNRCMLYVALTRAMVSVTLPWYLESSFE